MKYLLVHKSYFPNAPEACTLTKESKGLEVIVAKNLEASEIQTTLDLSNVCRNPIHYTVYHVDAEYTVHEKPNLKGPRFYLWKQYPPFIVYREKLMTIDEYAEKANKELSNFLNNNSCLLKQFNSLEVDIQGGYIVAEINGRDRIANIVNNSLVTNYVLVHTGINECEMWEFKYWNKRLKREITCILYMYSPYDCYGYDNLEQNTPSRYLQ